MSYKYSKILILNHITNPGKYLQLAIFFSALHAVFAANARLYIVTPYIEGPSPMEEGNKSLPLRNEQSGRHYTTYRKPEQRNEGTTAKILRRAVCGRTGKAS